MKPYLRCSKNLVIHITVILFFASILSAGNSILFADAACKDAYLYHFLNRSCFYGDSVGVRILLAHGTDPNGKGYEKYPDCVSPVEYSSPLMMAVSGGHIEIAQLLLNAGADPNILEGEGVTPLVEAVEKDDIEMVKFLLKNGAKIDIDGMFYKPLDIAKKKGNSEIIKLLSKVK